MSVAIQNSPHTIKCEYIKFRRVDSGESPLAWQLRLVTHQNAAAASYLKKKSPQNIEKAVNRC
jgi:hypothetical protein